MILPRYNYSGIRIYLCSELFSTGLFDSVQNRLRFLKMYIGILCITDTLPLARDYLLGNQVMIFQSKIINPWLKHPLSNPSITPGWVEWRQWGKSVSITKHLTDIGRPYVSSHLLSCFLIGRHFGNKIACDHPIQIPLQGGAIWSRILFLSRDLVFVFGALIYFKDKHSRCRGN